MAYDKSYCSIRILDAYGRSKRKKVELKSLDSAQAELDADNVYTAYAGVINGHAISMTVSGEKTYAGAAGAGSNVDTGVTMSCQLANRPERAALKWPTPDPTILNGDGTVDLSNAAVVAVRDLYVDGVGQVAYLSDGESITGFISGSLDK